MNFLKTLVFVFLFHSLLIGHAVAQEPVTSWRRDPVFQRLKVALDKVPAIDVHTHLFQPGEFDPSLANEGPLLLRSTNPSLPQVIRETFGITPKPGNWQSTIEEINAARKRMMDQLGQQNYWQKHFDSTLTEIALVNDNNRELIDGKRTRWVPHASTLLFPLPADQLIERSPSHKRDITEAQKDLLGFLKEAQLQQAPPDLPAYLRFVDETLRRWQKQGAVGIKFWDAYVRTLRIADVQESYAVSLYASGRTTPLKRDEYLAVQDYLWRHIMLEAGQINLPVHIHSSLGVPPFLRTLESDVRNLEDVLADPKFFGTQVILIHGGGPWHDIAIYLAFKPNVWVDISSMAFLHPLPEFVGILRRFFVFAPEKVLFGTDASNYPSVPGGAEVHHALLSRVTREALYLALAGLVRDGLINEQQALAMGRGVLRDNARRLHGWK